MSAKPPLTDLSLLELMYDSYRPELVEAGRSDRLTRGGMQHREDFIRLAEGYDLVLLDAYGVLNRGSEAIPGVGATLRALRTAGCPFRVVSNNASQAPAKLLGKMRRLGLEVEAEELVTSGMVVAQWWPTSWLYGRPYYLVGTEESREAYGPEAQRLQVNHPTSGRWSLMDAEWILCCSNRDYYGGPQQREVEVLLQSKGEDFPVVLANPDMVAPLADGGLDPVAGYTAAEWARWHKVERIGLGKPFPAIFELALRKFPGVEPSRCLMVGDTLETDILGGLVAGMATCLVLSGSLAGCSEPIEARCRRRGIHPDYVMNSIGCE
ncbi:MAG: HAD-IIA family hydrolase [Magnetococcales bacterium]|nr:HAD-IIA family hydrolase [Magnetococcales bacterium]